MPETLNPIQPITLHRNGNVMSTTSKEQKHCDLTIISVGAEDHFKASQRIASNDVPSRIVHRFQYGPAEYFSFPSKWCSLYWHWNERRQVAQCDFFWENSHVHFIVSLEGTCHVLNITWVRTNGRTYFWSDESWRGQRMRFHRVGLTRVPLRGWSGAGVGVGMLRAGGDSLTWNKQC